MTIHELHRVSLRSFFNQHPFRPLLRSRAAKALAAAIVLASALIAPLALADWPYPVLFSVNNYPDPRPRH